MPPTPWKTSFQPDPDREYLALLTVLPVKHYRTIPRFLGYTRRIEAQLAETVGLVGYSLRAELLRRRFWTLSVWEDDNALMNFVRTTPHAQVMETLQGHMGVTRFVRWTLKGASVPPDWQGALLRYRKETNTE